MIRKINLNHDDYDDHDDETPLSVSAEFSDYWHKKIDNLICFVAEVCVSVTRIPKLSLWVGEREAAISADNPGNAFWVIDLDEYVEKWGREPFRRYLNGEKKALDLLAINILIAIDDIFEDLGPDA